jgi:hypothetical protein
MITVITKMITVIGKKITVISSTELPAGSGYQ